MRLPVLLFLTASLLVPVALAVAAGTINVNLNINSAFTISGPASYSGGRLTWT
jgi:hypothetical protein